MKPVFLEQDFAGVPVPGGLVELDHWDGAGMEVALVEASLSSTHFDEALALAIKPSGCALPANLGRDTLRHGLAFMVSKGFWLKRYSFSPAEVFAISLHELFYATSNL
jgi:hypothetical protein